MQDLPDIALSLHGVTKTYANGVAALGPIDLDVRKGEFISLLGPSGCGKSTALRIIAGLVSASAGTVSVPGNEAADRRRIGFVFQEPTLMPWANARDNVALPLVVSPTTQRTVSPAETATSSSPGCKAMSLTCSGAA